MWQEVWSAVQAEPRWMAILGLGLDVIGGVLVAFVAWLRVSVNVYYGGPGVEPARPLVLRRVLVLVGAGLLAMGFAFQMWATYLQIP